MQEQDVLTMCNDVQGGFLLISYHRKSSQVRSTILSIQDRETPRDLQTEVDGAREGVWNVLGVYSSKWPQMGGW